VNIKQINDGIQHSKYLKEAFIFLSDTLPPPQQQLGISHTNDVSTELGKESFRKEFHIFMIVT
jgi:hypothetical protein